MKLAILQPYIFPYIGYFQLIKAVDVFVIYDDVNFMKKGWIHRNNILINGEPYLFTVPCLKISQNKLINETIVCPNEGPINDLLTNIKRHYKNAPYFDQVYPIIVEVFSKVSGQLSIAELGMKSLYLICQFLKIDVKFELSSKSYSGSKGMDKVDRIVSICKKNKSNTYINAIGGQELYSKDLFLKYGINLKFLKSLPVSYKQFEHDFVPGLSIIDVLMFNSQEEVNSILDKYKLI